MNKKDVITAMNRAQRWDEAKNGKFIDLMSRFPKNSVIWDMVIKTHDHIRDQAAWGGKIMVSISGGSDSDIMMDLFERIGYPEGLVVYVWFDTGLEYDATKRHLKDLEAKYGVDIIRRRAKITVAQAVKRYGYPFLSKEISGKIGIAQSAGFNWRCDDYDEMVARYGPVKSFARWWGKGKREFRFSVERNTGLKEYIKSNPPPMKISGRCCDYAKKNPAKRTIKELEATLEVIGVRRAEGGSRVSAYKSCFSEATDTKVAQFRPLFYLSDKDKEEYKDFCGVTYSDCYEMWGFKRTGCVCCPFDSNFETALEAVKQYEPKLYAAACKIFGPSYEYTRKYRRFKESFKREKRRHGQIDLFDNPDTIFNTETIVEAEGE